MRLLARYPRLIPLIRFAADATVGALLMMVVMSWMRMRHDEALFRQLVQVATQKAQKAAGGAPTDEARALEILHAVYSEVRERAVFFGDTEWTTPNLLWSAGDHMNQPAGACASYVTVLAKALQTAGYPVRKIGLEKNGLVAYHHVLETKIDGRWVLMDAAFDQSFRRPDGKLASAADVHANWLYYRLQITPDYYPEYDYSGFYYTNWDRIPGAGLVLGWFPEWRTWLFEKGVSIRFWFLNVYAWLIGLGLAGSAIIMVLRWRCSRTKPPKVEDALEAHSPKAKPKMPEWVRQQAVVAVPPLPAVKRS